MDFSQLMKVAAQNNLQIQRKLDERKRRKAESEAAEKKSNSLIISSDAVTAHLPKKPHLPPVKKRGGGRKVDDLELDDGKRSTGHGVSSKKQKTVDIRKKDTWPSGEVGKKEYGSRKREAVEKTTKDRKPMNFVELMSLAREQKEAEMKGKEKERETKSAREVTGKAHAQKEVSLNSIGKPIRGDKTTGKQTIHEGKSIGTRVKEKCVNGAQPIKAASKALPRCTMTSTTIENSSHQFHKRRHDKRNRESSSEEMKVKRLHVNPYLSIDDFPRKTTQQTKTSKKRHHHVSEELDFIDDDDSEDVDVSSHIREIFGYDRHKYGFENPSTACMETSYRDIMKEEKMSARIGHLEDLEEERKEREMMAKRKKNDNTHQSYRN